MAIKRYAGEYPVIGIRPIVDGRRGPMMLRESLEPQVWAMANAAKKLFEENLCYSNGDPVKVILADTCIGRVPEAAACADKFKKAGVDISKRRFIGHLLEKGTEILRGHICRRRHFLQRDRSVMCAADE